MKSEEARDMALNACLQSSICHYDSDIMIYKETNENLKALFEKYSVRDKDVLTVLASSDQLFSCYYSKAKSIDAFDRIPITLFYYYLRKWVILYQNKLYPSHLFFDENGDRNLYRLICNITPSCVDEANAKVFWKCYLEHNNYGTDKYLFYSSFVSQPKPFDHSLEDIKGVFDKELLFFDRIFFKPIQIYKKYDVLILSNLLEYANNSGHLVQARNNIESLLKDEGIAICTSMLHKRNSYAHKKEIAILTSHLLEVNGIHHTYYEPLAGKCLDLAYSYRLKKK